MRLRYAAMRSGKGRPTGKGKRVPDVETLACAATLGSENHELVNDACGVTRCRWCRETWGALDEAARETSASSALLAPANPRGTHSKSSKHPDDCGPNAPRKAG